MNVLHISPDFNYSCGVSRHVTLLLEELNKKSEIHLFFLTNGGDSLERIRGFNVKVDYLGIERENKNPLILLGNYFSLSKYCKSNKIDLIHTHHRYPELLSCLAGKRLKIKTIATVHSLVTGWKSFSFRSDKIIAVSKSVEALLICKYSVDKGKILQIYNYIKPFNKFDRHEAEHLKEELGIKETDKVLLFVGRISYIKGCDVLISAFEELIIDYPSLKLIMIGSFESEALKHLVLRNKQIIYIEPKSEIVNYYSICDAAVIPSRIDPLPYVMLEAGLVKKPFIGGNTGGIAEFIENGIDGLLVEPGDKQQLKEKIVELLNDESLSKKLAENLHKKVSKLTDSDSYITQLMKLYGR
ncbi:MAG: hypothetical protein CVV24_04780 [Ignavibacteriae bacterium HGW-Ignavibacteriae-3]|nr:MAG: hypothetical protein CVV24_04780 [Ignavibacteriae bacterium HGW-Ignavibacteriae-3]